MMQPTHRPAHPATAATAGDNHQNHPLRTTGGRPSGGSLLGRKESTIQGSNNRRTSAYAHLSKPRRRAGSLGRHVPRTRAAAAVRLKDCLAETDETVGQIAEALAGQSEAALEQTDLVEQEREEVMNALEKLHHAAFDSLERSVRGKDPRLRRD